MIRSWIAIVVLFIALPAYAAEDLPAPKPRAAEVPAPPLPELPLPDIGEPAKAVTAKPVEQPKVVAPSTLLPDSALPNSAFPLPAPSVVLPTNPNPSGTTPSLPSESSLAPSNTPNNNVPNELKWRYKWHNGQWWYWSPDERWMIWDKNSWSVYDAATYQAPAGFAKPGPRVVTQQSMTAPLPENYSGTEVSTPESYYIQPTPYAFGVDSYYGPYGPAASYYNRRSSVSISIGSPAYVPVYPGYLQPQYYSPRYTAPVGGYPGYGVPGYYGGRGVTIGFGF